MPVGSAEIIYAFFLVLIEHLFLYIDIFHLYYPLVSAFSHTFQCCRADCSSAYERNNHRHSVRIFLSFSRTDMLSSQHSYSHLNVTLPQVFFEQTLKMRVQVKPAVLPLRDHQMPVRGCVAGLN